VNDKKKTKPNPEEEKDVEGHNILATFDYYSQRTRNLDAELERDARRNEQIREAREAKKKPR
jgi:hypothetical protein